MKKKIAFVQASNLLSDSVFLPYAVGTIAAYAWQFPEIREQCENPRFFFIKEDVSRIVAELDNPFLVAFSNYMWNVAYNLEVAKEIKKLFPQTLVVFGGTQIPDTTEYIEQYPFVDITIHGEGEIPFYELLSALLNGTGLCDVKGISFRNGDSVCKTPPCSCGSLEEYPSPYTNGLFDSILEDEQYRHLQFDAVMETNRGCPYQCAYCAWSVNQSVIRRFPIEKVRSEIEWMAAHKIFFCFCADANFGILPRDEEIAQFLVDTKKKYGFPVKFETTAAKNKNDLTFRINSTLHNAGMNRGVSLACQSMSRKVLDSIGRAYISPQVFADEVKRYREAGMDTYTDLIIGLPEETVDSFLDGVFAVMEAGQHNSINMYNCELLPNSLLNTPNYVERYNIQSVQSVLYQNHSRICSDSVLGSRSDVVVQTSTMSRSDWLKIKQISTCVQVFHCMGLLRFYDVYLHKAHQISYREFYQRFFDWIEKESVVTQKIIRRVTNRFEIFLTGQGNIMFESPDFGDIYWPPDEALFLCILQDFDSFYEELDGFLRGFFEDVSLYEDLKAYSYHKISRLDCPSKQIVLQYDWPAYFDAIFDDSVTDPEKKSLIMHVRNSRNIFNFKDYAREIVWYGKRENRVINSDVSYEHPVRK